MSKEQSAETVEAEAANVRSQLLAVGADIRRRTSPAALVDATQASLKRRAAALPARIGEQSVPLALVLAGGALGVVATSLFSSRKRSISSGSASRVARVDAPTVSNAFSGNPSLRLQAKTAALSFIGVGLGYVGGLLFPESPTEQRLFARPKVVLRQRMDDFLEAHLRGMKLAALNMFGVTRIFAAVLIGLGALSQVATPQSKKAE